MLVNHEIQSKYFKGGQVVPTSQQMVARFHRISGNFFQLRNDLFDKVVASFVVVV